MAILPGQSVFVSITPLVIVENNEKRVANHSVVRDQIATEKDMAFTEEKFSKQLAISKLKLEEILKLPTGGYIEDISLAYEQIGGLFNVWRYQRMVRLVMLLTRIGT